jgi:hypothetical protein
MGEFKERYMRPASILRVFSFMVRKAWCEAQTTYVSDGFPAKLKVGWHAAQAVGEKADESRS